MADIPRFFRTPQVLQLIRKSRTTLWRGVRAGAFPPPVQPGLWAGSDWARHFKDRREAAGLPPMADDELALLLVEPAVAQSRQSRGDEAASVAA